MQVPVCVQVYISDLLKLKWVVLRDLIVVLGTEFRQSHQMVLIAGQFLWLIFIYFFVVYICTYLWGIIMFWFACMLCT